MLYVKRACPWCVDALAYFERKDLDLEIIDVRAYPNRMEELITASGQTMTPTLKHGDFVVADFDLEELEVALSNNPEARNALGL